ncbi:MAG: hypothetical protein QMC81_00845 [Thermoanaerobacterales bacterium]|nr:hypothetical protein [Thermoanaerobacterales bacterium]
MPDGCQHVAGAIKIEDELFQANGYRGIEQTPSYSVLPGSLPILLSAPHAVKHFRRANDEPKEEDEFTGAIVRLLHDLTGCSIIHAAYADQDANFYDDCPYKEGLRSLVIERGIKLVLDIHGAAAWRSFDIDIGSCKGAALLGRGDILPPLLDAFRRHEINGVFVDSVFSGCGQATVTRFASEVLCVPALQLEINKRFRDPENHPQEFESLIEALEDYLKGVQSLL